MSKISKKSPLRAQVETKLAKLFSEIEKEIGEKKFRKRIKKASKILSAGITVEKKVPAKRAPKEPVAEQQASS